LIEIDAVGTKLAQAPFNGLAHIGAGGTTDDFVIDTTAELGGQDDVISAAPEGASAALFARQVGISSVKEIYAGLKCGVYHRQDGILGHSEAKVIRTKSDDRDRERADCTLTHNEFLSKGS
jgi:hypothetical protein